MWGREEGRLGRAQKFKSEFCGREVGKDRLRAMTGRDKDGLGQKELDAQLVQASPGLGRPDDNGTSTV